MDVQVQVTNRNSFPLPGRYAAVDYVFPPNKPVKVPRAAADHIFGIGQDDKTRALNCLGILKGNVTYKEALEVLKRIQFEEGQVVFESPEPGKHAPGKHQEPGKKDEPEDEDEETESGDRPGAPKGPGGKTGAERSAPADLDGKRKW